VRSAGGSQRALIGAMDRERSGRLMSAMDACNRRWGRGSVMPAAASIASKRAWSTKFDMRSPRYTTRVDELPVVSAAPSPLEGGGVAAARVQEGLRRGHLACSKRPTPLSGTIDWG
jgi:hypothetical protein